MRCSPRIVGLLLVLAFSLVVETEADCRCCRTTTDHVAAQAADVVFVGTVVEAQYRWSLVNWAYAKVRNLVRFDGGSWIAPKTKRTATLVVDETLRGQVRERWTIHTLPTAGWCGVEFEVGEEYLIFGNKRGLQMWSGQCEGTRALESPSETLDPLRMPVH